MTNTPDGFTYRVRKNGDIELHHHGRPAGVLRGPSATRFLTDVEHQDPQELMARLTGNYRHGNERTAKNHPRNRPSKRGDVGRRADDMNHAMAEGGNLTGLISPGFPGREHLPIRR